MSATKSNFENLQNKANEKLNEGYEAIQEGGKDWLKYVETHPLQTLFFGIVEYFAMRGFVK